MLLQVKGGMSSAALQAAARSGNVVESLKAMVRQDGLRGLWKGNVPQVLRVIPYSAIQLYSYEEFKRRFQGPDGALSTPKRLLAGACAGMAATMATYPLDSLRLRMAVDASVKTLPQAGRAILKAGGPAAFWQGVVPALVGIAPYMALELCAFDVMKAQLPKEAGEYPVTATFARGFAAALFASSICYPMDTVRRQIQLHGGGISALPGLVSATLKQEGPRGLYRGFLPNAMKNLPNKGIRLTTFDSAKALIGEADAAYEAYEEGEKRRRARARGKRRHRA